MGCMSRKSLVLDLWVVTNWFGILLTCTSCLKFCKPGPNPESTCESLILRNNMKCSSPMLYLKLHLRTRPLNCYPGHLKVPFHWPLGHSLSKSKGSHDFLPYNSSGHGIEREYYITVSSGNIKSGRFGPEVVKFKAVNNRLRTCVSV